MISFFTDCCDLFSEIFLAAMDVDFFYFLAGCLGFMLAAGLFRFFAVGSRKLW